MMTLALISRPWNSELSNANAASMCSGSENSTYAKLVDNIDPSEPLRAARLAAQCLPFWVPCKLVAEDGNSVYCPARLEMSLYLLWCGTVVDLSTQRSYQLRRAISPPSTEPSSHFQQTHFGCLKRFCLRLFPSLLPPDFLHPPHCYLLQPRPVVPEAYLPLVPSPPLSASLAISPIKRCAHTTLFSLEEWQKLTWLTLLVIPPLLHRL